MMHQILHDPKLMKLDLRLLASAGAGAAYVSPDLRLAFQRRASGVRSFIEGSYLESLVIVLIANSQVTGCLKVYSPFAYYLYTHGAE